MSPYRLPIACWKILSSSQCTHHSTQWKFSWLLSSPDYNVHQPTYRSVHQQSLVVNINTSLLRLQPLVLYHPTLGFIIYLFFCWGCWRTFSQWIKQKCNNAKSLSEKKNSYQIYTYSRIHMKASCLGFPFILVPFVAVILPCTLHIGSLPTVTNFTQ